MSTIRAFLTLTAIKGWHLAQMEVNNAFFHGDLKEEVYMKLPHEYKSSNGSLPTNAICRLCRSLYGLKQTSRKWYSKLSSALMDYGFVSSLKDSSLFLK